MAERLRSLTSIYNLNTWFLVWFLRGFKCRYHVCFGLVITCALVSLPCGFISRYHVVSCLVTTCVLVSLQSGFLSRYHIVFCLFTDLKRNHFAQLKLKKHNKNTHSLKTVPKFNRTIVERCNSIPLAWTNDNVSSLASVSWKWKKTNFLATHSTLILLKVNCLHFLQNI